MIRLLIKKFRKTFVFHKADCEKINEHFSNCKWEDIFQNRNANECWMKFLEIARGIRIICPYQRGAKKEKSASLDDKKDIAN